MPARRRRVLFVYKDDRQTAEQFKALLETQPATVDLVDTEGLMQVNLRGLDRILIGSDTEQFPNGPWPGHRWVSEDAVRALDGSNLPIIALGIGGISFLAALPGGSWISGWYTWTNLIDSVRVVDRRDLAWRLVRIPVRDPVKLYNATTETHSLFFNYPMGTWPPADVKLIAREPVSDVHYPIAIEKSRFVLWAFCGGPSEMTAAGRRVFMNTVFPPVLRPRQPL